MPNVTPTAFSTASVEGAESLVELMLSDVLFVTVEIQIITSVSEESWVSGPDC